MTRFSQFAAPAIVGAALFVGAAGCATKEPPIPARAQLLSEGRETVSATAVNDGTLYIYDGTTKDPVYTGRVTKGDSIRVDAKNDRVMLNDRVAVEKNLMNNHDYQIYFEPQPMEAGTAAQRQGTVIQQSPGGSTVITPGQPGSGTTVVQPAQPAAIPPARSSTPPNNSNTTVVQPDGTTVVTPAR